MRKYTEAGAAHACTPSVFIQGMNENHKGRKLYARLCRPVLMLTSRGKCHYGATLSVMTQRGQAPGSHAPGCKPQLARMYTALFAFIVSVFIVAFYFSK